MSCYPERNVCMTEETTETLFLLRLVVGVLICISLQSCSTESTDSSNASPANVEYLYASQCELSEPNRPEACAPDAAYLIDRLKVGDKILRIPRLYLRKTEQDVREVDSASYQACWPGLELELSGCARFAERILFYMTRGSSPDAVPYKTKAELLAESTEENYTGPFRIEGTVIDEYRHRNENGVAPIFSFQAEDDVRIAKCSHAQYGRCIVTIWGLYGLSIRYEFGVNLIDDWAEIDAAVRSLVSTFVTEDTGD